MAETTATPQKATPADTSDTRKFSILLVDDDENMRRFIASILESEGHEIIQAGNGEEGLDIISKKIPHLIITDYTMPVLNGLDFMDQARKLAPDAARILCTGNADIEVALTAINRGEVNRFLTKPFNPDDLIGAVRHCLERVKLVMENRELLILTQVQNEQLSNWNQVLEKQVQTRTEHLDRLTQATVHSLAELAESRAQDIGGHLHRMQEFAVVLTNEIVTRNLPELFFLTEDYIEDLHISTLLHDVGKVGIPDGILFKPGRLTPQEFSVMKTHSDIGRDTVLKAQAHIGDESFLSMGIEIAGSHHERWDGKGYPDGLAGDDIPFAAQLVSIADVYDALTSARVYKPAWTHEKTIKTMNESENKQFSPLMIDALGKVEKKFKEIRENWKE